MDKHAIFFNFLKLTENKYLCLEITKRAIDNITFRLILLTSIEL